MKISVALCTYNGEKYLEEQLNSYLDQTFQPSEIIACDDGSVDKTLEILENFKIRSVIPVHIYRNTTRLGFTKNFEKAISLCNGDFIALSDQDDVWLPDKAETLVNEFNKPENENVNVIFTDMALVDGNLKSLNKTVWKSFEFFKVIMSELNKKGYFKLLKERGNFVAGASTMMRKKIVNKLIPFVDGAKNWYHDGQIALIAAKNNELRYLDKPLVLYRQHEGQTVSVEEYHQPPILSDILKGIIEVKKNNLFYFDKVNTIKILEKDERKRLVKEILFLEKRVSILGKKIIKRIIPVTVQFFALNYLRFNGKRFIRTAISDFLNH